MDMLLSGEHIILDVDHWLMFLRLIPSSPEKEQFWKEHRESRASALGTTKKQGTLSRRLADKA